MHKSSPETNPDRVRELAYEHPPHPRPTMHPKCITAILHPFVSALHPATQMYRSPPAPPWQLGHLRWKLSEPLLPYSLPQ